MNILEKIRLSKLEEVRIKKASQPAELFKEGELFAAGTRSLKKVLEQKDAPGIIAEFKRRSPSRGNINPDADPAEVTRGYLEAGACGLSVLTDGKYFGGSLDDLKTARKLNEAPILRKDFIIDQYQLYESKAAGADIILLIAALLDRDMVRDLAGRAKELGMEVLLEIHSRQELDHICSDVDMVGVNNRDLRDFTVDINISKSLSGMIPPDFVRVSESGISDTGSIKDLYTYGYRGFLIGGYFMSSSLPQERCRELVAGLASASGK